MTPYESEEATKLGWSRAFFREVYDAIRGSAELAGERGFHDLSQLFAHSEDLIFIDYCHTTESANERIARAISGDVEKSLDARFPRSARGGR